MGWKNKNSPLLVREKTLNFTISSIKTKVFMVKCCTFAISNV